MDSIAKAGVAPEQPVRMLSQTPLVLRLIGEDTVSKKIAAGGGVYAAPHVFDGTHPNMTPDMWKQLPEAMADPIAIFDTANPKHRGKGDVVFMVEIQDANGATVVVPVALDARGDAPTARINILKSAYAKEINGVPSNEWFKQQVKKNARYVNGQKLRRWQDSSGVYFPFTPLHNAAGNKVVTEADLVKLREANPTLYQLASGPAPFAASPDAFLAPEGSGAEPLVREGCIRKPDSAAAKVVRIEENAVPEFSGMKEFANWLKEELAKGGDVQISSTGQTVRFTRTNVGASVKRSRSKDHRNAYAALREMVTNAEYDHYEKPDVRHPHGGGQDVYHAALEMGGVLYSVKIKLDVVSEDVKNARRSHGDSEIEDAHYKDHKLAKIEIAPALYRDAVDNQPFTQPADAISEVTLGVLRGSVKPSGIDGGMLYQEGGPSQARGAYVLRQDGAALIALFRGKADISTVIHEGAGHFFLENLREAAQLPDAPAWVREGWRTVAEAIGADADPATAIATGAHETFARMAVDYMRSGRAPSDRLAQVFRRFARWLGAIWRRVRRRPDFAEVSPEVAAVMDRLLAAEEDIAATRDRVAPLPESAPEGVMPEAWADYLRLARKAESDAAALLTLRRMAWERAVERAARKEARALRAEDPDQRRVGAFAACIPRVLDIQKSCVRCLAHDFFALF